MSRNFEAYLHLLIANYQTLFMNRENLHLSYKGIKVNLSVSMYHKIAIRVGSALIKLG